MIASKARPPGPRPLLKVASDDGRAAISREACHAKRSRPQLAAAPELTADEVRKTLLVVRQRNLK